MTGWGGFNLQSFAFTRQGTGVGNKSKKPSDQLRASYSSGYQWRRRELNPSPRGIRPNLVHVRSQITQLAGFSDSAET